MNLPIVTDWKNAFQVERWKAAVRSQNDRSVMHHAEQHVNRAPLLSGIALAADVDEKLLDAITKDRELRGPDDETLLENLHRLEKLEKKIQKAVSHRDPASAKHQCPALIVEYGGWWIIHPAAQLDQIATHTEKGKARHAHLQRNTEKAKALYKHGLIAKAQRQLACRLLGGEVHCQSGHEFYSAYQCNLRYCPECGPEQATQLLMRHRERLRFVAQSLMLCGKENCAECNQAIEKKGLPHWPPPTGSTPQLVCAQLDFTVRKQGTTMPDAQRMRELNSCIKKFCRGIERRFRTTGARTIELPERPSKQELARLTPDEKKARRKKFNDALAAWRKAERITRRRYGLAYCDELGGNNNNPHAHGVWVGPWLPNTKKELSKFWAKIAGPKFPGTFIISIKYTTHTDQPITFEQALWHAVKYPAKFAERSAPQRLADLEKVFHGVRRFHTLARFYRPEAPENPEPPPHVCPVPGCGARMSDWQVFRTIAALEKAGLRDIRQAARESNDARANAPP
jgi:hypothetical protein